MVPEPTLDAHDPAVTATLKATQAKYAEGIMTYANGEFLHHYLTIKNTLTEVIRGDQEQALKEFYALLVHTSSTHAGFEFAICRGATATLRIISLRTVGSRPIPNSTAHDAGSGRGRPTASTVCCFAGVDGQGKTIGVSKAPTAFGTMGFRFEQTADDEAIFHLDAKFTRAPSRIVLHFPWWVEGETATVDGIGHTGLNGAIDLPATAREIHLHWINKPDRPLLSYERAVEDYKAEYARRYRILMNGEAAGKK